MFIATEWAIPFLWIYPNEPTSHTNCVRTLVLDQQWWQSPHQSSYTTYIVNSSWKLPSCFRKVWDQFYSHSIHCMRIDTVTCMTWHEHEQLKMRFLWWYPDDICLRTLINNITWTEMPSALMFLLTNDWEKQMYMYKALLCCVAQC